MADSGELPQVLSFRGGCDAKGSYNCVEELGIRS